MPHRGRIRLLADDSGREEGFVTGNVFSSNDALKETPTGRKNDNDFEYD